ncbi:hypothetical protein HYX12_01185, partial [Candidatus Woesearchaeota archaeon]|nr:hypothetical protein [Candidatus Woesearchaeota archaeon]
VIAESLACDESQRDTELLRSVVVDGWTKEPLELVRVGFTIPNQDECNMGTTDQQGEFASTYPPVYGGIVNFIKEDYLTNFYPIDTYAVSESPSIIGYAAAEFKEPVIELYRFKEVNVSVKKKLIGKCLTPLECKYTKGVLGLVAIPYKDISCQSGQQQCFFKKGNLLSPSHLIRYQVNESLSKYNDYYFVDSAGEDLGENETAVITLTKVADINENVLSDDYTMPIVVDGSIPPSTKREPVKLVPGIYKVDGLLNLNREITIPADHRSVHFNIATWEQEAQFDIAESTMKSYMNGRLVWDKDQLYLKITPDDLYTYDELTFYIPSQNIQDIPETIETKQKECTSIFVGESIGCSEQKVIANGRIIEDLQLMAFMGNISKLKRNYLEPEWG